METKKKKSLVTDRYNPVFREAGIAIAMALVLMSFNIKSKTPNFEPVKEIEIDTTFIMSTPITALPPEKKLKPKTEVQAAAEVIHKLIFTEKADEMDTMEFELEVDEFEIELPPADFSAPVREPAAPVPGILLSNMPQFPGGQEAFVEFLKSNLKYPRRELQWDISGKVYLQFTINKKGKVTDVVVAKGATANFDAEALRVGKKIPAWTPGIQGGVPVKCQFLVPIVFRPG